MKKYFIIVSMLLSFLGGSATAQTIEESNALYKEFVRLANQGGDKAGMYDALYRCYTANYAVLKTSAKTSSAYAQALNNMRNIIPYLPNAAAYSSSQRRQANAILFAKAYVDVASMPDFSGGGYSTSPSFAQLSYFAAANLVNARRYQEAIPYLKAYIHSGEDKYRKTVFVNLIKACAQSKDYTGGIVVLDEAIANYPSDYNILSSAVNFCIDNQDNVNLQRYVAKALTVRPNDETLLNIQGKLFEDGRDYEKALDVYTTLQKTHPRALDVIKHLAINNYNIGVLNFNKSLAENDKGEAKKQKKLYMEYFGQAVTQLKDVVMSEPTSLKYTQALAVAYNCLGNKGQLEAVNNKLASLGGGKVGADYIPSLISFAQNADAPALAQTPSASSSAGGGSYLQSTPQTSVASAAYAPSAADEKEIPSYSSFARNFIESTINKWQQKDAYETVSEYQARVTEQNREAKIKEVQRQAEQEYIRTYQGLADLKELELKPYDAENGVFLITSKSLGQLIVPVPRTNNEARIFESSWVGMQFKNPKYFIENDHLALANLTFVTPTGKQYQYDNAAALHYTETHVDVQFAAIDKNMLALNESKGSKQKVSTQNITVGNSDVDMNIPEVKANNSKTFAVIISNEHYMNVAGVPMALNDGSTFAKYCEKTLGMPHDNVRYYGDASYGTMLRAVRDIKEIAEAFKGDLNIVFYYAGHGIPNESTKDAFLLPVDADGTQTEGCYSLNRLYEELGSTQAKSIVVFLDACFSGAQRDGGMLASARGVALKVKKEDPRGNMVVFSAASGDETAFPYKKKEHGLFTYYLLKKLQDTKGNVSLGELSEYLTDHVKRQSVVINRKVQTPSTIPSASMASAWRDIKLK